MILNMTGGGAGIAVSVVHYASANSLPAIAKENTIAVITNTAIPGFVFSEEAPSSPATGTVWFYLSGGNVPVFVEKKKIIILTPEMTKQWDGSSFVSKEAHVFQNGEWVNFTKARTFIYESGDTDVALALAGLKEDVSHGYAVAPTLTQNEDHLLVTQRASSYNCGVLYDETPKDLSKFNAVKVRYSLSTGFTPDPEFVYLRAYASIGQYAIDNISAEVPLTKTNSGEINEISLDVSSLDTNHIIAIYLREHPNATPHTAMELMLYDWWLE